MSKPICIYSLQMGDGPVFYVGRTTEPIRRLWVHRSGDKKMPEVASIVQRDPKSLRMEILEVVSSKPRAAELKWIRHFRNSGIFLVNKQRPAGGKTDIDYTPQMVEMIRRRAARFEKKKDIAKEFDVTASEIGLIVRGKKYPNWAGPILGKDYW